MAYDLEEQEQLDELKAWWKTYGSMVLLVSGAIIVGLISVKGWKYYQNKQSREASVQYEVLTQSDPKDIKVIQSLSGGLMEKYVSTPYAGRAAVLAAKANFAVGDAKSAKAQLEWATKNAQEDPVKSIALLQLAAIQLDEKHYDAALKTLAEKHDAGFDGIFADLKGDILVAQNKKTEAKAAYEEALIKLDVKNHYSSYTQHKLEALGN
jgi:predicted negative regulator of RcsB-dependent stress response